MDWGSVIANAVGGAATGLVSMADSAQKDDQRRELETLKGQLQMDRLQASIEGKFQAMMAGIEGKLAVQEAKNDGRSSGGSRAKGLIDMDEAGQSAAADYFGAQRKPTDRTRFETTTKQGDPLSRMSPEDEAAAIESGGDVGDALSRKMNGMVSTALDTKGYAEAEDKRIKQNLKVNTLLTNAGAIDNLSKADAQDIINKVTEFALKNPKADVGELLDRLGLLKPGDKRIAADKDGNLWKEATGERVGERVSKPDESTKREREILSERRVALDNSATNIRQLMALELRDPILTPAEKAEIRSRYEPQLKAIDQEREEIKLEMKTLQSRLSKPAATAGTSKTSTTTKLPSPKDLADQFKAKRNATN